MADKHHYAYPTLYFKTKSLLKKNLYCICAYAEVREPLAGVGSLLPTRGSWGLNSSGQAWRWRQAPLPSETSHQPLCDKSFGHAHMHTQS